MLFDEAPASKSALVDLLDAIQPYKELIVIVFGVIGGGIAVKEYIATKEEVKILTCQAQYGREMLENRMAMQQAKSEMNDYDQKLHPFGSGFQSGRQSERINKSQSRFGEGRLQEGAGR